MRTPPWKESEGCLFSGAAKGCPLWDSQADEQKGEQTADHTAELSCEGSRVISDLIQEICDSDFSATGNIIFFLPLAKLQILDVDECLITLESVPFMVQRSLSMSNSRQRLNPGYFLPS